LTFLESGRPLKLTFTVGFGLPVVLLIRVGLLALRGQALLYMMPLTLALSFLIGPFMVFAGVCFAFTIKGVLKRFE